MASRPKVKVRTGCLTCKARKIKCDESKPSCRRCSASGRICNGYANKTSGSRVVASSLMHAHGGTETLPGPGVDQLLSNALTNEEHRWLDHFSSYTGPLLSEYQDNRCFWSVEIPQLSISEPAIRHALLAVSSCHARFETRLGSTTQVVGPDFTIKHYSLAIASLRQALRVHDTRLQMPLVCCLLFICLECLYGNTALTLTHLQNGLKMLESRPLRAGESQTLKSVGQKLEVIFDKFKAQSTVFGLPASFSVRPLNSMDFTDVLVAQTTLDALIRACMSFVKHMGREYGEQHRRPVDADSERRLQSTLLNQLLAWEARMECLEQSEPARIDCRDASVVKLHIRQQATYVYVARCLDPHETFCDAFLPRFRAIIELTERFVASSDRAACSSSSSAAAAPSPSPSLLSSAFSLESSIIPALWLTVIKCREPATRRRAIRLLDTHPGREGLWDARLYAKAARRVVEIEEAASLSLQPLGSAHWPDERCRVYRTDVSRISEEPARSARLTFHTAPNGCFGAKVIWSEDTLF